MKFPVTLCVLSVLLALVVQNNGEYMVGLGRADITGPIVEVTFMGYAKVGQTGRGLHLRQFARTFIVQDGDDRIAFVIADACMMGYEVRKKVLENLKNQYGDLYNENNFIISGTHTHSAPAGFLMDFMFNIPNLGFVQQTFDALVSGITLSVTRAHESLKKGRLYVTSGELLNANINRSPASYVNNPEGERARYEYDVDKTMVQLRFESAEAENEGELLGAVHWFAVHPTSMNNTNRLVSSDNVGYASILLETTVNKDLPGQGAFVGAFASTNLGDVSPNILGPRCLMSGLPCDILTSTCANKKDKCAAPGPGRDIFESTQIIATRIFTKGLDLLNQTDAREVTGPLKYAHQFIDMPNATATFFNQTTNKTESVRGCSPAMGYSFIAGTTDGPGPVFEQGRVSQSPIWNMVRDILAPPTPDDIECHAPKPIFIATGRMNYPTQWQPHISSAHLALIGDFGLIAVPGEFTTMSGRRMRERVLNALVQNGAPEQTQVVVVGLSNVYTDYIATPEEYQIQRYEGASTVYGPHTLSIYLEKFEDIAVALMKGDKVAPGPTPPDISDHKLSLVPPVILDSAGWMKKFGDCLQNPAPVVYTGDTVVARFVSGNPRNNLLHEKTFLTVEKKSDNGTWVVVANDACWETKLIWKKKNILIGKSEVEINWTVGPSVDEGYYRIQHFGYYKQIQGKILPYQGTTNSFVVKKSNSVHL